MSSNPAGAVGARPNPERVSLAQGINHATTIDIVAKGIALAIPFTPLIYVERRGAAYRWSPAHRGGPYPLMRITAKFLQMDHGSLVLPFRALDQGGQPGFGRDGFWDGVCIVRTDDDESGPADEWTLLEFDAPATASATASAIRARILKLLAVPTKEDTRVGSA